MSKILGVANFASKYVVGPFLRCRRMTCSRGVGLDQLTWAQTTCLAAVSTGGSGQGWWGHPGGPRYPAWVTQVDLGGHRWTQVPRWT